ncbi:TAF1, transcription initiation factor TFIID, subunit TAF1 [Rickenella mellea]|uniref:TAF1, transcription initiation factor TFIID, subunit TAF1 n=1 Tax=Rickenella mellea TaxID=50990 RepID=A0A4Y7QKP2_9AGAM|nr:TAF1, transcription initiation factor TFIID, subunit TAF1 [Rickenella mellea]
MSAQDENAAISALTGFSLEHILTGLQLPSSTRLPNELGISGIPSLSSRQIYNENWDEDAVGAGEGEDWEDEVNRELENEQLPDETLVKAEVRSPDAFKKERRVRVVRRVVEKPRTVYERFPAFERGKILAFTELFKGHVVNKSRIGKRQLYVETVNPRKKEVPKAFLKAVVGATKRQVETKRVEEEVASGSVEDDLLHALQERSNSDLPVSLSLHDRSFDMVLLSNWEEQIIYEPDDMRTASSTKKDTLTTPVNTALESGIWTQSIIWDAKTPFRDFSQIEYNHEDDIVPEDRQPAELVRPRKRARLEAGQPRDKFNLSNDHLYEVSKDGHRHRVRQTFGQLVVQHAYPAQKLQLPFYKTRLSKHEARSFHRPALQFPANIEIRFNKVRTAKKKKDKAGRKVGKGGDVGEGLRKTTDLTLKDTSNFVLWEFSEENPPIISNFGMGSVLVNYYRKMDDKDEHIPKADLGEPFVLEPGDESPFMKFGYVYAGQTIQALYNNLIRAPIFRQKPYPTDFLVVRSTIRGETKYYIRDLKHLFVVGQTYPVNEVPGPHSRKITSTIKNRLQIIAFKLLRKSQGERLKISRLMKYFPDQNELQMRQRLKEFMEYHRRGPHQGFWRLKENVTIPSDQDMLKMVVPEQVVLSESMQVGQRHLQDAGYGAAADNAKDDDESNLSVEQQLAPWITTKNFQQATQAKAMLRLHGEGDPTGRGEAFSFIRVSMKDIFVRAGEDYEQKMAEADNRPKSAHRYNVAEQQTVYKSEIERIWKAQFASLSRKDEPQLTAEDEERVVQQQKQSRPKSKYEEFDLPPIAASPAGMGMGMATPGVPAAAPSPAFSRGSSLDREVSLGPDTGHKVLRIKRMVDGETNIEIVRDPAVIRAYVRRRQIIEEEATMADSLAPTGDEEKDKRAKKRLEEEIARMKKNQERRLHRKNAKIAKEGGTPMQLNRPMKPDTTRRCGHCGQMGHMKTNRKCPRWAEFNSGAPPIASPTGASPSGAGGALSPGAGLPNFGFNAGAAPLVAFRQPSFGGGHAAAVPSPLATSPPVTAMDDENGLPVSGSGSAPKIKLTLKRT